MIPLKFHYAPLELDNFETFEEKINAVSAYLELVMFCGLRDEPLSDDGFQRQYLVTEILVPGGQPSYVKSFLQRVLVTMQQSLDNDVANAENYLSATMSLEQSMKKCFQLAQEYDIDRSLSYDENKLKWWTIADEKHYRLFLPQLVLEPAVQHELVNHFDIRKEFFEELVLMIDRRLSDHLDIAAYPNKPYIWDSEHQHLEIAELLLALIHCRVRIKEGNKTALVKFVKEFYNLFGLDESPYHGRVQQIRNRKKQKTWLIELVDYYNAISSEKK